MSSGNKSKNIHLLFVSNSCWSIHNFRTNVLLFLQSQGYTIHVAATRDAFTSALTDKGFIFHEVFFDNRQINPAQDVRFYYSLKAIYRKIKPALIFHYVIKPNIYGSLAASRLGIPSIAVITGLGYSFSRKSKILSLVKRLYAFALRKVSEVWFLNAEDAFVFEQAGIGTKTKTRILNSEGIDTERFDADRYALPQNKRFTFLMSTRLLHSKGVGIYAKAAAILKERGLDFDARIIGFFESHHPDSVSKAELKQWQDKGLIQYDGFAENVLPHLVAADCFILPSSYPEGVPVSLLEGASLQIPLITTNNIGCREVIIDGETGFICKMNNPQDLADKMEMMMRLTPNERNEMGRKGREHVIKKFDIKIIQQEYLSAVQQYTR